MPSDDSGRQKTIARKKQEAGGARKRWLSCVNDYHRTTSRRLVTAHPVRVLLAPKSTLNPSNDLQEGVLIRYVWGLENSFEQDPAESCVYRTDRNFSPSHSSFLTEKQLKVPHKGKKKQTNTTVDERQQHISSQIRHCVLCQLSRL